MMPNLSCAIVLPNTYGRLLNFLFQDFRWVGYLFNFWDGLPMRNQFFHAYIRMKHLGQNDAVWGLVIFQ